MIVKRSKQVRALLLIGGKSRRMGRDKAELRIGTETLQERIIRILKSRVADVRLSVSHADTRTFEEAVIRDLREDAGPLGALEAAFEHDSECAWLLCACDLPLLDEATVGQLLDAPDSEALATCFANRHDHRAEPLCALYQPLAAEHLQNFLAEGGRCARGFLESLKPFVLELDFTLALENANRPESLDEIEALQRTGLVMKSVNVEFFGKLSQEAQGGLRNTNAATLGGLYEELRMQERLSLDLNEVKAVLNDQIVGWKEPILPGSEIAFLPPFAGG